MSDLRPWLVRVSRFPLSLPGAVLGTVEAHDHDHADSLAAAKYPRPFTIEPAPRVAVSPEFATKLEKLAARIARRDGYVRHDWPRRSVRRNTGRQEDR